MIKDKREKVEEALVRNTKARDNDNILLSDFWRDELLGDAWMADSLTIEDFFSLLQRGSLSTPESITRCRRKVQEINPELRGETWKRRHNEYEETVKSEIKEML